MPAQPTELETYFLQLVNGTRAEAGVSPLTFDDELMVAADNHSAWMDATDTFSHTGANGSSPEDRISAAGYEATWWGENISEFHGTNETANTQSVEQSYQAFLDDPVHYQNMVNPNFQDVGISVVGGDYQGDPAVYVTMDFGTAAEQVAVYHPSPGSTATDPFYTDFA
jgi:serralysin